MQQDPKENEATEDVADRDPETGNAASDTEVADDDAEDSTVE